MARKTAILKITAGDKVPKDWQWQIDNLKRFKPVAGTEGQWARYVGAVEKRLQQLARFEQACDLHDKFLSDESRALMHFEGKDLDRMTLREMQLLDAWRDTVAHINDAVIVPEEDVRNVVNMSITDKIEVIDFTLNHGLLASKVAQALRKNVTEFDGDVPLCAEHA